MRGTAFQRQIAKDRAATIDAQPCASICGHCGQMFDGTLEHTREELRHHLLAAHGIRANAWKRTIRRTIGGHLVNVGDEGVWEPKETE